MYKRRLKLDLPTGQSAFLWGPRKSGKTTYLKKHFPDSVFYDFLKTETYSKFLKKPELFREEILDLDDEALKLPIIVDEIQRIPALLNEIHWLIENTKAYFILCGSSARQLRRGGANLLGGRAWRFEFFPLISVEIDDFDLIKALNNGLIPSHYESKNISRTIRSYLDDYLKEEIKAEGLVRNLAAFANFVEELGYSNGELLNYSNIARDCGIDAKTVKEYYQILVDTLLGSYLAPYPKSKTRQVLSAKSKFYLFDVGVAGSLRQRKIQELKGSEAGKAFEHFIYMELLAYNSLKEKNQTLRFWQTNKGLEVDFIVGQAQVAIECKIKSGTGKQDLKGLIAFCEENPNCKNIVVSTDDTSRKIQLENGHITVMPWQKFLKDLWSGKIF